MKNASSFIPSLFDQVEELQVHFVGREAKWVSERKDQAQESKNKNFEMHFFYLLSI